MFHTNEEVDLAELHACLNKSGSLPDIDIIIVAKLVTDMQDTVRECSGRSGLHPGLWEITFRELVHVYIEITSSRSFTSL